MSSLTLLNLKTPPAPAPEPTSVSLEAPTKPPTMDCNRPVRPKYQPNYPGPRQVRFEGAKVEGAGVVHPRGHDNAGKGIWPDAAPEHGPANFNCSALRKQDLAGSVEWQHRKNRG
jgi:hypothetical protein